MKKRICFLVCIFLFSVNVFADDFIKAIQFLALQTACIGQYSATQAGGGWNDDPYDYYTPSLIAERLKNMSGEQTRTNTFYGVCFDYAQEAYNYIYENQAEYNDYGLKDSNWYIVGSGANGNSLSLYEPCSNSEADVKSNGVYLRTKVKNNTKAHKQIGDKGRATNHAWLQIQRNDGVWFWIDPTWSDNLGYIVYGYVLNGEEIQLRPDKEFCLVYPDYLNDLPSAPKKGFSIKRRKFKSKKNSNTPSSSSSNDKSNNVFFSVGYIGTINLSEFGNLKYGNLEKGGLEVSFENITSKTEKYFSIFSLDYLADNSHRYLNGQLKEPSGEKNKYSCLFGLSFGRSVLPIFEPYIGGSLGFQWPDESSNAEFAWKVNAGIRLNLFKAFVVRGDLSVGSILGPTGTIAIGKAL